MTARLYYINFICRCSIDALVFTSLIVNHYHSLSKRSGRPETIFFKRVSRMGH